MRWLLLLALLADFVPCLAQKGIPEFVNRLSGSSWIASDVPFNPPPLLALPSPASVRSKMWDRRHAAPNVILPESYDPRSIYPASKSLNTVLDQAECGSCWAFASSGAIADRLYRAGLANELVSAQQLVDCNKQCYPPNTGWGEVCNSGCHGGFIDRSFDWIAQHGVVSERCRPYQGATEDRKCHTACDDGAPLDNLLAGATYSYSYLPSEAAIMEEIVAHGSVAARFTVYIDFLYYAKGIYRHMTGGALGGHAVKLVGYGMERGIKYWIVQNSWGPAWGEDGYFRMVRGEDDAGIEADVWAPAVIPDAPARPEAVMTGDIRFPGPSGGPVGVWLVVGPIVRWVAACVLNEQPGHVTRLSATNHTVSVCNMVEWDSCVLSSVALEEAQVMSALNRLYRPGRQRHGLHRPRERLLLRAGLPMINNLTGPALPPCRSLCHQFAQACLATSTYCDGFPTNPGVDCIEPGPTRWDAYEYMCPRQCTPLSAIGAAMPTCRGRLPYAHACVPDPLGADALAASLVSQLATGQCREALLNWACALSYPECVPETREMYDACRSTCVEAATLCHGSTATCNYYWGIYGRSNCSGTPPLPTPTPTPVPTPSVLPIPTPSHTVMPLVGVAPWLCALLLVLVGGVCAAASAGVTWWWMHYRQTRGFAPAPLDMMVMPPSLDEKSDLTMG
ncbi:putative cathepsin B2 cysteine protease [Paratrimastix pyriformis]|uniref:Cathepsin B2 cysteine protease n=1 Tax=Paratrimastix pyriformis TaxID=342808 RepID=A0ABQ8UC18_9EUKA|nr:putative cathepsin B2 cysteine protease [Paratrimastix pyriformis]